MLLSKYLVDNEWIVLVNTISNVFTLVFVILSFYAFWRLLDRRTKERDRLVDDLKLANDRIETLKQINKLYERSREFDSEVT